MVVYGIVYCLLGGSTEWCKTETCNSAMGPLCYGTNIVVTVKSTWLLRFSDLSCGCNLIYSYLPVFCFQSSFKVFFFFQLCSIHMSYSIFCSLHLCLPCPWFHECTFCYRLGMTLGDFSFWLNLFVSQILSFWPSFSFG